MGPDLQSKRWIIVKGVLFLVMAIMAGALVLLLDVSWPQRLPLLLICIWASCRFYYFFFHVLHAYVDPSLPSAGVIDLIKRALRSRR